jgi:hypothetical protein
MQKYRADIRKEQNDCAVLWSSQWMGGPTLARVNNCRLESLEGNMRATVYVTGAADTFFSIPAVCSLKGARVRGYLTSDDDRNIVFRHCYY